MRMKDEVQKAVHFEIHLYAHLSHGRMTALYFAIANAH